MRHEFRLADIGEGLEEAEIIAWRIQVGDVVERDQPLVEVMTDKSNAELPAPHAGTVVEIGGGVGDMISVGELVAVIDDGQDAATAPQPAAPDRPGTQSESAATVESVELARSSATGTDAGWAELTRPKASPSTRREAARRGIDLATITGSGPGGRILASDLDSPPAPDVAAAPGVASAVAPKNEAARAVGPDATTSSSTTQLETEEPGSDRAGETVPLRGIRRRIARNMTQSWSEVPHIHAFEHIDAEPLLELRKSLRLDRPEFANLTPLTFFVAAVASALRAHPEANSSLDMARETITTRRSINVGIAVAAQQGLVVPVVRSVDQMSLAELCLRIDALVVGARGGALDHAAFTGGTATVTNFGSLGGEQATPLIRPPESVIIGFGAIAARPFVVDDAVVARKTMHVVVGADHRLLDGDVTTAFLGHVTQRLVEPLRLLLGP